jgi:CspA family cold shock protein
MDSKLTGLATVREWHDDDGWGVLESGQLPGPCWTHFSAIEMSGYHVLVPGSTVEVTAEYAEQDGYHLRAVEVRLLPH